MGKTYVYVLDLNTGATGPVGDQSIAPFSVYNEAMSYAEFLSYLYMDGSTRIVVWNHSGGSGYFQNGNWTDVENRNYPS